MQFMTFVVPSHSPGGTIAIEARWFDQSYGFRLHQGPGDNVLYGPLGVGFRGAEFVFSITDTREANQRIILRLANAGDAPQETLFRIVGGIVVEQYQ